MPTMVGLKEFTVQASAVRKYGVDKMMKINAGMMDLDGESKGKGNAPHKSFNPVYNINVDVAKTDAKPEEIASAVIRHLDSRSNSAIQGLGA
jgi:hypothetical protein